MAFETAFLLGRILVGVFFLFNGITHFKNWRMMVGYAKSKHVPASEVAVLVSGALLVLGGLSILFGVYPYVGILLLVLFLVPVTLMMHNFWAVPKEQKMGEMINFMKNMALLGSVLMFLVIPTPWPYAL